MITYYHRTLKSIKLKRFPKYRVGCWIDVAEPTEEELIRLSEQHKLELGHLRDALDPFEVPRVEKEGSVLYLFLRMPIPIGKSNVTKTCLLIIAPTFFATVSAAEQDLVPKLLEHPHLYTSQKSKMFVLFMMAVFGQYHSMLVSMSKQINELLTKVHQISNRDILSLINYENYINEMLTSIIPLNETLKTVLTGRLIQFFKDDEEFIEDLYLTSGQLVTLAKNQLTYVHNTREAYSTIMTNNLNRVIKLFTSLTVILTVPTITSSFYGMNVLLPGANHVLAFPMLIAGTVVAVGVLIWFFNRQDWL